MGLGINSGGESAGDTQATSRQVMGKLQGVARAGGAGVTTAHHGHLRRIQQIQVTTAEKQQWRVAKIQQFLGIERVIPKNELIAVLLQPPMAALQQRRVSLLPMADLFGLEIELIGTLGSALKQRRDIAVEGVQ